MALHPLQSKSAVNASFNQLHSEGAPERELALGPTPPAPVSNKRGTIGHLVNNELSGLVQQATAAGARGDTDKANQFISQINALVDANYDALTRASTYRGQDPSQAQLAASAMNFLDGGFMRNDTDPSKSLYALSDPESEQAKMFRAIQYRAGTDNSYVQEIEASGDNFAKDRLYSLGYGKLAHPSVTGGVSPNPSHNFASEEARQAALYDTYDVWSRAKARGGETQAYAQMLEYLKGSYGNDALSALAERDRFFDMAERVAGGPLTKRNLGPTLRALRTMHSNFFSTPAVNPAVTRAAEHGGTVTPKFSVNSVYSAGSATRDDNAFVAALSAAEQLADVLGVDANDPIAYQNHLVKSLTPGFRDIYENATNNGWLSGLSPVEQTSALADALQHELSKMPGSDVPTPDNRSFLVRGSEATSYFKNFLDPYEDTPVEADDSARALTQADRQYYPTARSILRSALRLMPAYAKTGVEGSSAEFIEAMLTDADTSSTIATEVSKEIGISTELASACVKGIARQVKNNPDGRIDLATLANDIGSFDGTGKPLTTLYSQNLEFNQKWDIAEKPGSSNAEVLDAVATTFKNDGLNGKSYVFDFSTGMLSDSSMIDSTVQIFNKQRSLRQINSTESQVSGVVDLLAKRFNKFSKARLEAIGQPPDVSEFSEEEKNKAISDYSAGQKKALSDAFHEALGITSDSQETDAPAFYNPANAAGDVQHIATIYKTLQDRAAAGDSWANNVIDDLSDGLFKGDQAKLTNAVAQMASYNVSNRRPKDDPHSAAIGMDLLIKANERDVSAAIHMNPKVFNREEQIQLMQDFKKAHDSLRELGGTRVSYDEAYDTKRGRYLSWATVLAEYSRIDPSMATSLYERMCRLWQLNDVDKRVELFGVNSQQVFLAQRLAAANENINDTWEERQNDGISATSDVVALAIDALAGVALGLSIGHLGYGTLAGGSLGGLAIGVDLYRRPGDGRDKDRLVDLSATTYGEGSDAEKDMISAAFLRSQLLQDPNFNVYGERNEIANAQANRRWGWAAVKQGGLAALTTGAAGAKIGGKANGAKGAIIGAIGGFILGATASIADTAYRDFWFDDPSSKELNSAIDASLAGLPGAIKDDARRAVYAQQIARGQEEIARKLRERKNDYDEKAAFSDKLTLWYRIQSAMAYDSRQAISGDPNALLQNTGSSAAFMRGENPSDATVQEHYRKTGINRQGGLAEDEAQAIRFRAEMAKFGGTDRTVRLERMTDTFERDATAGLKSSPGNVNLLAQTRQNFAALVTEMEDTGIFLSEAKLEGLYRQVLTQTIQQLQQEELDQQLALYNAKQTTSLQNKNASADYRAQLTRQNMQYGALLKERYAALAQQHKYDASAYKARLTEDPGTPTPTVDIPGLPQLGNAP